MPPGLVLASASPRRKALLEAAGYTFRVVVSPVEELPPAAAPPRALCQLNAQRKARAVAGLCPGEVVVGADTIVVLDGVTYGKPRDLDDARRMLGVLCGRTHEVLTGVCIARGRELCVFAESTRVKFRALGEVNIDAYLLRIDPLDKAGAYAAQEDDGEIIGQVEGLFSNVVGLPVERLAEGLERLGVRPEWR